MMSHEIRTPLNGMLGMSRLLEETPLDEEQQDLLRTSLGAGETLLAVLNDVLDFSKLDAGRMTDERIPVRIRQLLRDLVALYRALEDDTRLLLSMTDTGIGISDKALETLLDPVTQAESSTTRRFGGTGLGLTVRRKLVELMHGEVRAESTLGEGSTFTVHLPLQRVAALPGRPRR